jgi:hypothetical protein
MEERHRSCGIYHNIEGVSLRVTTSSLYTIKEGEEKWPLVHLVAKMQFSLKIND